ncbi:hypothetical protein ESA94_15750 [Lacibacter luteus]|uniref:tRNA (5-methylaminomethyl-2-thiouridylate)-methyltransferase n=1 Tax=Lacibacter luteus TaxID=2508719 RepID=A0A4Q1CFP4_9BACT|nr:hypothetical protein [Lacibacter luteus]RXK58842.1 hypothetical protein ESA94_15750 [Lacibacter luteus]
METTHTSQKLRSVYSMLKLTYGIVPIVAGLDKFTNLLANWEQYLNPALAEVLPFSPHTFMMMIGVVEIAAGVIVLLKPTVGGYVVMAWLSLIAFSLLASKEYLDVAVRDLVMAIGAYSFVKMANIMGAAKTGTVAARQVQLS